MYRMDDLFNTREVVGAKLENIMRERGIQKTILSRDAKISRPTLNKLLAGEITNKVSFSNHMEKLLNALSITPDVLMSNVQNPYARTKSIRRIMRINSEEIHQHTGIPIHRIHEIDSGSTASLAELRDIAFSLQTGVKNILGREFFAPQSATLSYFIPNQANDGMNELSGFWGHIGIKSHHCENYLWYPISESVRSIIYRMSNYDRMVIPCMNNRLLYVNTNNIDSILILDEACDQPGFTNWDPCVDCGDTPQVVYESLDDYLSYTEGIIDSEDEIFSEKFLDVMKLIVKKKKWDETSMYDIIKGITVHFSNGHCLQSHVGFREEDTILQDIEMIYCFDEISGCDKLINFSDVNGSEILLNFSNVSMIDMPLSATEDAISRASLSDDYK